MLSVSEVTESYGNVLLLMRRQAEKQMNKVRRKNIAEDMRIEAARREVQEAFLEHTHHRNPEQPTIGEK